MDSMFQHELKKIRNNDSGEYIRFQVEFEQNMDTVLIEGVDSPSESRNFIFLV